jgi:hypothetical protein
MTNDAEPQHARLVRDMNRVVQYIKHEHYHYTAKQGAATEIVIINGSTALQFNLDRFSVSYLYIVVLEN